MNKHRLRKQLYNGNSDRQNSLHNSTGAYYADKELPLYKGNKRAQANHVAWCKGMLKRDIVSAGK